MNFKFRSSLSQNHLFKTLSLLYEIHHIIPHYHRTALVCPMSTSMPVLGLYQSSSTSWLLGVLQSSRVDL